MRKKFSELAKQELANNPNSYVLLGDISVGMFMDKDDNLPDRVLNMGIAEQAMVGFAGGLTTAGGNVIVHTIAAFLVERAFEQIKLCCGYNNTKLTLISANGPFDYDKLGPTHHCASDVSILATIPNFNIRVPATVDEVEEAFVEAMAGDCSTYIRLTSRAAKVDHYTRINDKWKMIDGADENVAFVCIGESLTFHLSENRGAQMPVYWTQDPRATLPEELLQYSTIIILEPYTVPQLKVPNFLSDKNIIRRTFKLEHNKIMEKNMGWKDFWL
jgi:transketolase